jgi:cysteine-rich repeat protein
VNDASEQCDDGNKNNTDGCTTACKTAGVNPITRCGDGVTQQPNAVGEYELCDDGNNDDGDGCDSICQPETPLNGLCGTGTDMQTYYGTGAPDQSLLCNNGSNTNFLFTTGANGTTGTRTWACNGTGAGSTNDSCEAYWVSCGDGVIQA